MRPRSRKALLEHPDYYRYRQTLLDFLEAYEGGATPDPDRLEQLQETAADTVTERTAAEEPAKAGMAA